jgi:hypothetical protein
MGVRPTNQPVSFSSFQHRCAPTGVQFPSKPNQPFLGLTNLGQQWVQAHPGENKIKKVIMIIFSPCVHSYYKNRRKWNPELLVAWKRLGFHSARNRRRFWDYSSKSSPSFVDSNCYGSRETVPTGDQCYGSRETVPTGDQWRSNYCRPADSNSRFKNSSVVIYGIQILDSNYCLGQPLLQSIETKYCRSRSRIKAAANKPA